MKLKMIRITPECLAKLLRGEFKTFTTKPNIPKDLKIIDVTRHFERGQEWNYFDLIVESEEFEDLPETSIIPELNIIVYEGIEDGKET